MKSDHRTVKEPSEQSIPNRPLAFAPLAFISGSSESIRLKFKRRPAAPWVLLAPFVSEWSPGGFSESNDLRTRGGAIDDNAFAFQLFAQRFQKLRVEILQLK